MTPATNARDYPEEEQLEPFEHGSSAEVRIGTVVAGSYRLTRHIGSGGSSHVFEAEHLRLGKPFAVKLLRPELDPNRRTAQRFRREARAIARLKNEHIVSVIDCGELDDGTPYLVMELLEGEDLRSLLNREGSLPARRAVPLIVEACRGLSEVHAAGLVHRDLKPENLFVTRRSTGEDWCKVLDFGVAKMDASLSTAQGAIVGTLRYMAPEQLEGGSSVGPTSDIYALGSILYECLCGEPAHAGDTAQEVMYSVMNRATPDAPLRAANVPASLIDVVMSCLAKKQEPRPRDTSALVKRLSRSVGSASSVASATVSEDDGVARSKASQPPSPFARRIFWGVGLTAIGVSALVGWARLGVTAADPAAPSVIPRSGGATAHSASATLSATPAATTVAMAPPATAAMPDPAKAPTSVPQASAKPRSRSGLKLVQAPGSAVPSAQPPRVAVGTFDPANPYGE
jgi:serine/threonine-protein kinase